jgi:hypothetical protein
MLNLNSFLRKVSRQKSLYSSQRTTVGLSL